jgi:hypothetical protein
MIAEIDSSAHLGPEQVPNLVKIFHGQNQSLAKVLQQSLILGLIMEWENGFDMLPLAPFGGDTSTTKRFRPAYEVIDGKNILGLVRAIDHGVFVATGMSSDDAK